MASLAHRPAPSSSKKQVQLTEKISLKHHTDEVWDVSFSHDGTRLASSGADKITIICSVDTFEVLHSLQGHSAGIGFASWSPDDTKLVTCSQDKTAIVWDTSTGKPLQTLMGFNGPVTSCAWIPSSQEFITTALTNLLDRHMSLVLWSTSCPDPICVFPPLGRQPAPLLGCILLPDDRIASFDNKRNIYIHSIANKNHFKKTGMDADLSSMCMSKLGKPNALLMRNDGLIEMIDVRNADMATNMVKVFKMKSQGNFVIRPTFGGENEEFVVSGSEDGDLYIWSTETGEFLLKQKAHEGLASCNSVASNSKRYNMIATAGDDRTVRIFSINDDDETWEHVQPEDATLI